jgi:hypothetical protein
LFCFLINYFELYFEIYYFLGLITNGGRIFLFGLFSYLLFNPHTTEPLHYIMMMSLLLSSSTIAMTLIAGCPPLLSPSPVLGVVSKTSKLILYQIQQFHSVKLL